MIFSPVHPHKALTFGNKTPKTTPGQLKSEVNPFDEAFADEFVRQDGRPGHRRVETTESMKAYTEIPMRPDVDVEKDKAQWNYLDELQRAKYEMTVKDGRVCDAEGKPIVAEGQPGVVEVIYVINKYRQIYFTRRFNEESLKHPSFLDGGNVIAAGHMWISAKAIMMNNHSGHYLTPAEQLEEAKQILIRKGVTKQKIGLQKMFIGY